MSSIGPFMDEAKRFREEIKRGFTTQVALSRAIGAKDSSYFTAYVTGRNRIGNILRGKLEAVGIDVDYIRSGVRGTTHMSGASREEGLGLLIECSERVQRLQKQFWDVSRELQEVTVLLDAARKALS